MGQGNYIPAWRQPKLLEIAASRSIDLSATDFPPPDERVKLGKAA
jgi:hypothetical protein